METLLTPLHCSQWNFTLWGSDRKALAEQAVLNCLNNTPSQCIIYVCRHMYTDTCGYICMYTHTHTCTYVSPWAISLVPWVSFCFGLWFSVAGGVFVRQALSLCRSSYEFKLPLRLQAAPLNSLGGRGWLPACGGPLASASQELGSQMWSPHVQA